MNLHIFLNLVNTYSVNNNC